MQEARGKIALFTDADLSAPIEEAGKLIGALENYDVAIGSRAMDPQSDQRSRISFPRICWHHFNKIVRVICGCRLSIRSGGFKAFRREKCGIIFEQQRIERFGFDPELLYLARHHGLRTVEIPVRWGHSAATKGACCATAFRFCRYFFTIRWNATQRGATRARSSFSVIHFTTQST